MRSELKKPTSLSNSYEIIFEWCVQKSQIYFFFFNEKFNCDSVFEISNSQNIKLGPRSRQKDVIDKAMLRMQQKGEGAI